MNFINNIKGYLLKRKYQNALQIINNYRNIDGWLTDKEAYGLYNISGKLPEKGVVVEIGSWKGKSTYCIAKGLKKGVIFAIDPFNAEGEAGSKEIYEENKGTQPLIDQFQDNMKLAKGNNSIEILQGYSNQFADHFQKIDFLFIDGDHSIEGCQYDYQTFSGIVKIGGYIAFHDFYSDRDDLGPTWVIKNLVNNDTRFVFFRQYDSLWVAKRVL